MRSAASPASRVAARMFFGAGRLVPALARHVAGFCLMLAVVAASLTAEPLAPELAAKIDRIFARWDRKDSPGAIVAIARDGEMVFARGYGMASLEHGVPMSVDTLSETGSVAKQFTAAAVTLLAVRGKLSLDDPLRKHLPELPEVMNDVTLRMVLLHTSGIRDIHGLFDLLGRPTYTNPHENAEVLEVLCRQRALNFPAGSEYGYSNGGYLLLTFVVARASGLSFARFCEEQVFKPHGMTRTSWREQFNKVVPGRASAYAEQRDGTFRVDLPYSNVHGNGGVLTTVGDLMAWNASLDHPTGEWIEVVRQMQTPGRLRDGTAIENGLGLRVGRYRGLHEISHSGGTAGYSTFLARFPSKRLAIAILGNSLGMDASAQTYRIVDALLGAELPPVPQPAPITLPREALAAHAGLYHSLEHDMPVRVALSDDRLVLNGIPLRPTGPHTFIASVANTRFTFDQIADGQPGRVSFTTARIARRYVRKPEANPSPAELAAYAGNYHCPELEVTVPVTVQQGMLHVRISPQPAAPAGPTFPDGFYWSRGWHLTFTRDANGTVNGFEATNANGRCRRVKFERKD